MEQFLGITRKDDSEECLQDIHQSSVSFGYFPTYAQGNVYAAQYFSAFVQSFRDWETKVTNGSFVFINDWLREHIHQFGRMYNAEQNVKRVTGHVIFAQSYKYYIMKQYRNLAI